MNKVCVKGQRIYFYKHPEPIPKSQVNFSRIEFDMDETWGSFLSVVAQFIQGGNPKNVQVKDGYCFVPPELEVGAFELCLRGDDGESVVASVNRLTFEVCDGFDPSGETPLPPSPDLYTQLIKEIDSGKKIAQSVREDADAGKFNGITPTIGANDNWYVGQTDTGVPAKGETGPQGPAGPALAVTNTAAVGQTVRITAVDENGQPAEWEAVDFSSGGDAEKRVRHIATVSVTAGTTSYSVTVDSNGDALNLESVYILTEKFWGSDGSYVQVKINKKEVTRAYGASGSPQALAFEKMGELQKLTNIPKPSNVRISFGDYYNGKSAVTSVSFWSVASKVDTTIEIYGVDA